MTDDATRGPWITDTPLGRRYPIYTRMNSNDVLPDPITPLGASLVWNPEIFPVWWYGYALAGGFTPAEAERSDWTSSGAFVFGKLYANMTATRIMGVRGGIGWRGVDTAFFGGNPEAPPHEEIADDVNEVASAAMLARVQWALTTTSFDELDEERAVADRVRADRPDFTAMSAGALVAHARALMPLERLVWRSNVLAASQSATGPAIANAILGAAGAALVPTLISSAGDVDSAAPTYALWDLSRLVVADPQLTRQFDEGVSNLLDRLSDDFGQFTQAFESFQRNFGSRGPAEWDLGSPTWETHPELALALIDRMRQLTDDRSPLANKATLDQSAGIAWRTALDIVGEDEDQRKALIAAIASGQRFGAWRERAKANCVKVLHEARMALLEFGGRLHAAGTLDRPEQIFMALSGELELLLIDPAALGDRLTRREEEWRLLFDLQEPTFIDGRVPLPLVSELPRRSVPTAARARVGDVLRSDPASGGFARGLVRVLTSLDSIDEFQPGEVLVAPQTDPSWTPLFMVACAVVVDVGSLSSHAVIVSRELGIPCVAGATAASLSLKTGDEVEVDATNGTVTVLSLVDAQTG